MTNREELFMTAYMDVVEKFMQLNRRAVTTQFQDYKHAEVETVALVGQLDQPNVTELAEATGMTRGGVTKLMNKLVEKDLVVAFQKPANKKERYFRLTESGGELNRRHEALHNDIYARDEAIFATLSDAELNQMLAFAQTLIDHFDDRLQQEKD